MGAEVDQVSTIFFVDLDGTVIPDGAPRSTIPHAKEALDALGSNPENHIWFFSCWAGTRDNLEFLQRTFPYSKGFICKPLADRYVFIDNKHDVSLSVASEKAFFPPKE